MVIGRSNTNRWQVVGHQLLDGSIETRDADVFQGIGFYARPAADETTEAIVAFPGGPGNPIVIALRAEASRRVVTKDLGADETQVHNSGTIIRIKSDNTVEIRTHGGDAERLVKLSEFQRLADDFYGHGHPSTGAPPIPTFTPPDPPGEPMIDAGATGTDVLRAE